MRKKKGGSGGWRKRGVVGVEGDEGVGGLEEGIMKEWREAIDEKGTNSLGHHLPI